MQDETKTDKARINCTNCMHAGFSDYCNKLMKDQYYAVSGACGVSRIYWEPSRKRQLINFLFGG